MSDLAYLVASFCWGLLFGVLYCGALWWTVRRLTRARRPLLIAMVSYYGRITALVFGMYLVMDGQFARLAACFAGFFLVRAATVRRFKTLQPEPARGREVM